MIERPDSGCPPAIRWFLLLLLVGGGRASAQTRAGPPVQVSAARPGEPHYEVLVAAHPSNPRRLLVGSMLQPAGSAMVSGSIAYLTEDGGATWRPTLETPSAGAPGAASGDPAVAFGPDGSGWFVASLIPPNSGRADRGMLLYRSPNGGVDWEGPTRFTYSDREYITIDASGGAYHGRVHVNGNGRIGANAGGLTNFYSSDAGRTFTESVMPRQEVAPVMGNAVVLSDGTLITLHSVDASAPSMAGARPVSRNGVGAQPAEAVPADAMRVRLLVSASRDGGRSFGAPRDVALATLVSGRKGGHNNTSNLPVMAVDGSTRATRDRLYVVWPEHDGAGTSIRLSWSADRGVAWSASRVVADAQVAGRDDFMPAVAVNRDGVVGVLWYDRRDREDNIGWDVRFAASNDGGVTFLPSVRVSSAGTRFGNDDAWIVEARAATTSDGAASLDLSLNTFTFLGGDTAGLVADATGVFHAVWVDNSSGVPQVWTAPITVDPGRARDASPTRDAASRNATSRAPMAGSRGGGAPVTGSRASASATGSRSSAGSETAAAGRVGVGEAMGSRRLPVPAGPSRDVTAGVTMEVSDPRYDRATNVLTVRVRLQNTSARAIASQLVLAAGVLRSELGEATVMNADGIANADTTGVSAGAKAAGAVAVDGARPFWSFEPPTADTLQPGAYTETRTLAFRLSGLRSFRDGNRYRRGLVNLSWTAVVY
jgi:hypothetical protein